MTGRPLRAAEGGLIDRSRPLAFTFDGRRMSGYAGDTLASALLANGVRLFGRSFKYHRPRGLLSAGVDEPNALVEIGVGGRRTTNLRATEVEITESLEVRSVNRWPSLAFDLGAINSLVAPFLAAGFYYKTFMWPTWAFFEGPIRRAAGIGTPAREPDPDRYEMRFAHCDVLVVGSGPAGLAAARAAAGEGARVILVEQDVRFGGSLLWRDGEVEGRTGALWAAETVADLRGRPDVRLMSRATTTGYYDHNALAVVERPVGDPARERLWSLRARRVVLATGTLERPIVFPGNDRPGVMLVSAAQQFAARYAVRVGDRVVVFTNNDTAYTATGALQAAGARIVAIADARAKGPETPPEGVAVFAGARIVATRGRQALKAACIRAADGAERWIDCDALLMSGGWNPTVHLFSQSGGSLRYDEAGVCFRPDVSVQAERSAGAANGTFSLSAALLEGHAAGAEAAAMAGVRPAGVAPPKAAASPEPRVEPVWRVEGPGKAFVDFQNDVTADDIALAARENFVSVEHLKRYTTLGMAPDQGKSAAVNALAIMGELTGRSPSEVGTTRYRPPFTPTSLAAFAGRARGDLFRPIRRTPLHDWHASEAAVFEDFGGWLRPAVYARIGEDHEAAVRRECVAVRTRAGLFDASTLGKIEVAGPDAASFLDRIYANEISSLKPGRVRYGLMLDELGAIIDDGVAARLATDRFLLSTTSGGAERIAAWLEEWRQCEWPSLRVLIAPVTTDWGVVALTGPLAREILAASPSDIELSAKAFPHMRLREGRLCGVPVRIARVSFTGEATFEINIPADRTSEIWSHLIAAGRPLGLEPVGVDAWMRLRTEKGYFHVGVDTEGTTVPADVGFGHVARRGVDFVGKRSLAWAINQAEDRLQLVGLAPLDARSTPPIGARLASLSGTKDEGFVSSSGFSPTLGRGVAIGLVRGGRARMGEELVLSPSGARVRIAPQAAYDPQGERIHG